MSSIDLGIRLQERRSLSQEGVIARAHPKVRFMKLVTHAFDYLLVIFASPKESSFQVMSTLVSGCRLTHRFNMQRVGADRGRSQDCISPCSVLPQNRHLSSFYTYPGGNLLSLDVPSRP